MSAELRIYLETLFADADGLIELAAARRGPDGRLLMRSRRQPEGWCPVERAGEAAARLERRALAGEECFVGVLPRRIPEPRRVAVGEGRVLWVDLDAPEALERARRLAPPAHLEVASGRGRHLYWLLDRSVAPAAIERANRRLAVHLGADPAACDRLRLLRAPGSPNGRAGRRARLLSARPDLARHDLGELLAGAPELPERIARPSLAPSAGQLGNLAPADWFRTLCGVEPDASGWVRCPLPDHEDRTPSCMVYDRAERGFYCFGCARGGGLYDLASLMHGGPWGAELRGADFRRARGVAMRALGTTVAGLTLDGAPRSAATSRAADLVAPPVRRAPA